jgi:hypothetical protein
VFAYPRKRQTPVVLLLSRISAYSASKRNRIDPGPVIGLMRAEAPRCAVVCGISCIRPWAPYNDTPFPMPDGGGLFECLRSGPDTPHPSGASSKPLLQTRPAGAAARAWQSDEPGNAPRLVRRLWRLP